MKLETYISGDLPLPPALFNLQHRKGKFSIKNSPSDLSNFRINHEILELIDLDNQFKFLL